MPTPDNDRVSLNSPIEPFSSGTARVGRSRPQRLTAFLDETGMLTVPRPHIRPVLAREALDEDIAYMIERKRALEASKILSARIAEYRAPRSVRSARMNVLGASRRPPTPMRGATKEGDLVVQE